VSFVWKMEDAYRRMLSMRGARSQVVDVGGQPLHHYELKGRGKGPPVVLVHGLGGMASEYSAMFFKLAERFERVLAVDMPGHGFSPDYCLGQVCVRGQYEVLVEYCRKVVGQPAFLVGNSLGGAMSVMLAAEKPEMVRALGLVSPAGADVGPERWREVLEAMDVRTSEQARALNKRLFHQPPWVVMLFAGALSALYTRPGVRELGADALANGQALKPEMLRSLSMPVLLVWGKSERLLPPESLDFFQAHLPPHANVRQVEGFGHLPQLERPKELLAELLQFADAAGL
jgi:pimeloyl-ACP methyl ester carboxylesterase